MRCEDQSRRCLPRQGRAGQGALSVPRRIIDRAEDRNWPYPHRRGAATSMARVPSQQAHQLSGWHGPRNADRPSRSYTDASTEVVTTRRPRKAARQSRAGAESGARTAPASSPIDLAPFRPHGPTRLTILRACFGSRPSTLGRRVSAIRCPQARWPFDDEQVKATMRGIRRTVGTEFRPQTL
jgi:hypothetical protein